MDRSAPHSSNLLACHADVGFWSWSQEASYMNKYRYITDLIEDWDLVQFSGIRRPAVSPNSCLSFLAGMAMRFLAYSNFIIFQAAPPATEPEQACAEPSCDLFFHSQYL